MVLAINLGKFDIYYIVYSPTVLSHAMYTAVLTIFHSFFLKTILNYSVFVVFVSICMNNVKLESNPLYLHT